MNIILPNGIRFDFSWRTNCCDLSPGRKAWTSPLGRVKQSQVALQSITFINHSSLSPFWWGSCAHHGRLFWRCRSKVIFSNYQLLWPVPLLMPFIYKTSEKKPETNGMKYNLRESSAALQHHYGSACIYQRQRHWLAAMHENRSIKRNDWWKTTFAFAAKKRHFHCSGVYKEKHFSHLCRSFVSFF